MILAIIADHYLIFGMLFMQLRGLLWPCPVGAASSRDLNGASSTYIRGWKPLPLPAGVK